MRRNSLTWMFLAGLFLAACSAAATPAQREEAQRKLAEYQLARSVAARSQTCLENLLPELRATLDGKDRTRSEQELAAKWGLERFDPNTGFDDAWAACVGAPTLKDLGLRDNETARVFLERKRSEWERAQQAAGGSVPRNFQPDESASGKKLRPGAVE